MCGMSPNIWRILDFGFSIDLFWFGIFIVYCRDFNVLLDVSYVYWPMLDLCWSQNSKVWTMNLYNNGSVALLSRNTLKRSAILGLRFFVQCWWPRESMLWGSSALSKFRTSLSKVLTLWHCVKVKQHYHTYT